MGGASEFCKRMMGACDGHYIGSYLGRIENLICLPPVGGHGVFDSRERSLRRLRRPTTLGNKELKS